MLESMQAGCPVIASKIDTLEEIGLDAALYFNPESAEDLSIKINSILENNNFSKELVRKGFTRSKNFSWQKCAEQTLKLYEKLKLVKEVRDENPGGPYKKILREQHGIYK